MGGCLGSLPTTPCPPCPIDALQSHFSEPGDLSLVPSPCNMGTESHMASLPSVHPWGRPLLPGCSSTCLAWVTICQTGWWGWR